MIALVALVALVVGMFAGVNWSERPRRAALAPVPAPNVFGDIVLPAVDDPRWRRRHELGCTTEGCKVVALMFGRVHTCIEHGCHVDGLDLGRIHDRTRVDLYVKAVRAGYMTRLAMEAIESHDPELPAATPPEQLLLSST